MRAVESGSVEIVKILLARGAKINLRTKNEKTALDIAYEWGNSEIIDLITASIAGQIEYHVYYDLYTICVIYTIISVFSQPDKGPDLANYLNTIGL